MEKKLTDDNFQQEVLEASGTILVDFWAPWCAPCRMQSPIVEELAQAGYTVGKVNVDENPVLASQYQVMSIPTLIIFENGQVKERMVGLQSKEELEQKLASAIA